MSIMRGAGVSQRKKLEEQHAQTIKQLLTQPENKFCFECGQRGPTYVNMTNGSFCCMHCSGLLRGLHPPHRVKAISMSTFTAEEVDRLKTLGNGVNSSIWLGLFDGRKKFEPRIDEEVRSHLIEKYENRRWHVSPGDVERQKQLLEEHAAHRRNSLSAVSIHSQKSNQSAPPNLHPQQQSARSGPIDLLTGDLFELSLSSTPVQQSTPTTIANQQQFQPTKSSDLKSPQDEWADLFTKPIPIANDPIFPLNQSSVPAPLQFHMPSIPPPKPKEHLATGIPSSTSNLTNPVNQQWESFVSMPKSATVVGGINAPSSSSNTNALDELFSNFNPPNGQQKTNSNDFSFSTTFDSFTTPTAAELTPQNNGLKSQTEKLPENWNPFLS